MRPLSPRVPPYMAPRMPTLASARVATTPAVLPAIRIEIGDIEEHHFFPAAAKAVLAPRGRVLHVAAVAVLARILQPQHAAVCSLAVGNDHVLVAVAVHIMRCQRHHPTGRAQRM